MSDFGLEAKPQELLALGKYCSTATSAIGMIPVFAAALARVPAGASG
jgi:hypothetical protein